MKPIEIEVPWLPGILAITLWPFILYRKGYKTKCRQVHEHYHWHEQIRCLVIPWFAAYLVLEIARRITFTPMDKHPMEVTPYALQRACEQTKGKEAQSP